MVNKSLELLVKETVKLYAFPTYNHSHILDIPILPAMHNLANISCFFSSLHPSLNVPQ